MCVRISRDGVLYLFYVPCLVYLFIIIVCLSLDRTVLLSYFITFSGMISPTASPHLKLPRYFCCDFCFRINFLDLREGSYVDCVCVGGGCRQGCNIHRRLEILSSLATFEIDSTSWQPLGYCRGHYSSLAVITGSILGCFYHSRGFSNTSGGIGIFLKN